MQETSKLTCTSLNFTHAFLGAEYQAPLPWVVNTVKADMDTSNDKEQKQAVAKIMPNILVKQCQDNEQG